MKIKIRFIRILIFSLISMIFVASSARANKEIGIAAIVGDSAISTLDVKERVKIAMFASNMPADKGMEEKLLPQILRNLIDEKIYRKEAEALQIEVTDEEMNRIVADIENRNRIRPGKFKEFMQGNNLSATSMLEQIKSQLTWNKIVSKIIRPKIVVTDKEIDEQMENILKKSGTEELSVSEILLVTDTHEDKKKIKELADKLASQLQKGGDFAKIAKEFSKASSAEKGGEKGWVNIGQFTDEVSVKLKKMKKGEVSSVINTPEGYMIIKLNDKRTVLTNGGTTDMKAKVREGIFMKKFEIQASRYLRDLRRGTFVEVRM